MKIAIPTDDGFTISQQCKPESGFLVTNIQFGNIIAQEMRGALKNGSFAPSGEPCSLILDCQVVIARNISSIPREFLQLQKIELVETNESLVTNALKQFTRTILQKESDTCCCP